MAPEVSRNPSRHHSNEAKLTVPMELLRCHYNFVRPHRALKFGREVRTPAMQAGLTNKSLTLRAIFSSRMFLRLPKNVIFMLFVLARPVTFTPRGFAGLATIDYGSTDLFW